MEDISKEIDKELLKASIFRIGEVFAVNGREITVKVDTNKNLSHLIYCGELIRNVSVGSYVKITKGFIKLVGKVESEQLKESKVDNSYHNEADKLFRILIVKLIGYFEDGEYNKGIKELPLIGDTCYLMDNEEFSAIHRFADEDELALRIGHLMTDENVPIQVSVNKLFASHIGVFGNTGSGKSHTLASIYGELFKKLEHNQKFQNNARFVLFDFNGEYSISNSITKQKRVYNLSADDENGDRLPFAVDDLIRLDTLSILSDATEKTQKPFINRTIKFYRHVCNQGDEQEIESYFKNILRKNLRSTCLLKDANRERYLFDLANQILIGGLNQDEWFDKSVFDDIEILGNGSIKIIPSQKDYLNEDDIDVKFSNLIMSQMLSAYKLPDNYLERFIAFLYLRLIKDVVEK